MATYAIVVIPMCPYIPMLLCMYICVIVCIEDDALTDMKIGLPYIVVATSMILIIIMCIVRQKKQSSDQR